MAAKNEHKLVRIYNHKWSCEHIREISVLFKSFFSFVIIIITYFEAEPIKLLVKQSKIEPKYNHYK